ncbi:MAG: VWA domain-containing protein [Candidatus Paceibacterota bacterium]|jgi:hypothetical protein
MRTCPIYILVDTSTFIVGEPFKLINKQITELISRLRQDPCALEKVRISFITFGNTPKILTPLTDLCDINFEDLFNVECKGIRNLKDALAILYEDISQNLKTRTNYQRDFDYRPFIIIFIGGESSDWSENTKSLLSVLGAYTKPEAPDGYSALYEDDYNPDDSIKESICFCTFNDKVQSIYFGIGKYYMVIGKDDISEYVKKYFYGFW